MRVQWNALTILLALGVLTSAGQSAWAAPAGPPNSAPVRVTGVVRGPDGNLLPGATVSVKDSDLAVVTGPDGHYVLDVPEGLQILLITLDGFAVKEAPIRAAKGSDVTLNVTLELGGQDYEVTVAAELPKLMNATDHIGVVTVEPRELALLPSLGETDVFRAMQLMPGVAMSNEASSGLYVRGGTPDQNLVLFDGFHAYDVDHFFGVFSAFNPNAVDQITLHKGGFESKYGGRLSSVVELTGKNGAVDEWAGGGGAGFLSANTFVRVPLAGKGSLMVAGRKSYQSPFSDRIYDTYTDTSSSEPATGAPSGGDGFRRPGGGTGALARFSAEPKTSFFDVNARALYLPTNRDILVLSSYAGRDELDNSRSLDTTVQTNRRRRLSGQISDFSRWGNTGLSATWTRTWTSSFISRVGVADSRYFKDRERGTELSLTDSETGETPEGSFPGGPAAGGRTRQPTTDNNDIGDVTVMADVEIVPSAAHRLGLGLELTDTSGHYAFGQAIGALDRDNSGQQFAVYAQDTWQPAPRFSITPGVRVTHYDRTAQAYAEPRLAVTFQATAPLRVKIAAGRYHQFAMRLVREDPLEGDQDFWAMADGTTVPVASATHFVGGVSYETPTWLFDIEGYRKNLDGLSEFASVRRGRFTPGETPDLATFFYTGTGRIDGLDMVLQKKFGRHTGWISYTLGRVRYTFPDYQDDPFPASHDSTHELKVVDSFRIGRWTFSGTWVYATGKPHTEVIGTEEIELPNGQTFELLDLGAKNAARLPAYHRLDLSATWDFFTRDQSKSSLGVSIFNAYGRQNLARREYDIVSGELVQTDVGYLGFTISAFVNLDLSRRR